MLNPTEWRFERSSGYAGYRNDITGEWLYMHEYMQRVDRGKQNRIDIYRGESWSEPVGAVIVSDQIHLVDVGVIIDALWAVFDKTKFNEQFIDFLLERKPDVFLQKTAFKENPPLFDLEGHYLGQCIDEDGLQSIDGRLAFQHCYGPFGNSIIKNLSTNEQRIPSDANWQEWADFFGLKPSDIK